MKYVPKPTAASSASTMLARADAAPGSPSSCSSRDGEDHAATSSRPARRPTTALEVVAGRDPDDHGQRDAGRADRRDDRHRADRQRPVEGAERDDARSARAQARRASARVDGNGLAGRSASTTSDSSSPETSIVNSTTIAEPVAPTRGRRRSPTMPQQAEAARAKTMHHGHGSWSAGATSGGSTRSSTACTASAATGPATGSGRTVCATCSQRRGPDWAAWRGRRWWRTRRRSGGPALPARGRGRTPPVGDVATGRRCGDSPAGVDVTLRGRSPERRVALGGQPPARHGLLAPAAAPPRRWDGGAGEDLASERALPPPPTTDSAIAATIASGTRIATPEARSACPSQVRTTNWTVARHKALRCGTWEGRRSRVRCAWHCSGLPWCSPSSPGWASPGCTRRARTTRTGSPTRTPCRPPPGACWPPASSPRPLRTARAARARPSTPRLTASARTLARGDRAQRRARASARARGGDRGARGVGGAGRAPGRAPRRRATTPRATTRASRVAVDHRRRRRWRCSRALALVAALVAACAARSTSSSTRPAGSPPAT